MAAHLVFSLPSSINHCGRERCFTSDFFIEHLPWQLTNARLQKGYDSENSQDFGWFQ